MVGYSLKYLFPFENTNKAAIFQNMNSKIRGFKFRSDISTITKLENDFPELKNYAVYFLIDNSGGTTNIYIGQSSEGITRIKHHHYNKSFWNECIIFVTENHNWDRTAIDYLEHIFIQKFLKSSYLLENKEKRQNTPNINMFDKYDLENTVLEIEKMLACNGLIITNQISKSNLKIYKASRNCNAKLTVNDGKFILLKGSEIKFPTETSKDWSDNGKFYENNCKAIEEFRSIDKISDLNGKLILTSDIEFSSPSKPATLVSGYSENGWKFWKGLDALRKEEKSDE